MKSLLASVRHDGGYDPVDRAVRSLEEAWRRGEPHLERHWAEHDPDGTTSVLAALVKADLRCRFARGRRPAVNDYLDCFPILRTENDRVLSLIYEEFCLREEQGEQPDAESFCERYAPWRDSLASQLKYHQLLSRVVGPPTAPPRFPEPGEHFQEFAIDSLLGQGGAARVYRARNDLLGGREVALKVSADRGQEPSIMGRLDHEHIVPVHNVVFQSETKLRGLIMPYRPGLPLDEVIRRVNPSSLPRSAIVLWEVVSASAPSEILPRAGVPGWGSFPVKGQYSEGVAWIILALARAVAYAHSHDIQHRDIKPANVLLTLQNGPQLLDFNLAHDPHAADQAEAAMRGGTLPYMAPEQLEAFIDPARWGAVGAGADLYSLGLVMNELLTGQAPDVPDQSIPLPRAIRSLLDRRADFRVAPRRLNPAIPHALEAITIRCLAYLSEDRYPSAQALADDLQSFLDRRPLRHAVNPSAVERLGNWNRRHWLLTSLSLGLTGAWSYSTLRLFTPIERRKEFLDAVAALEDERPAAAIELLEPLVEEFPNSPLVQFYLGAASQQTDNLIKAAKLYSRAINAPNADAILMAWGRKHPSAIQQFESLGIALDEVDPPDPKNLHKYPELARVALGTAIRLGSTDHKVFVSAAHIDEFTKDYASARDMWTALIDLIKKEGSTESIRLFNSYDCFHYRARVTTQLGIDQQSRGGRDAGEKARALFLDALEDLDQGQYSLRAKDPDWNNQLDFIRAEAEIGLGDLDAELDRWADARSHYWRAKKISNRLAPNRRGLSKCDLLAGKVDERIKRIESRPDQPSSPAR
jgi:serine/threonine protein kinase